MSFHLSAANIRVDDGHMLRANLTNGDGEQVEAEFDLNGVIGNNNGFFEWGAQGFADSGEEISFSLEGDDQVPILRAQLPDVDGNVQWRDINLAERISNDNGSFVFQE